MKKGVSKKESFNTYWNRELQRLIKKGHSKTDAEVKIIFRQSEYDIMFKRHAPELKKVFNL